MAPRTAPTPAATTIQEVKHTPDCPLCSEPIRNPAGYIQLLAYQAAIGSGAMTTQEAAELLLRDDPPDAAA